MIKIEDLHKSFGSQRVLAGVNLNIEKGQTTVIIGRSGCGKSVLLRHIVG
ncbi:MAG: ATP-binding cassette domain-containing protein, partial [Candidatus Omnitrophica bacterium]|nr:ATP-binding cassette domain-containing protein [Candidatus Omnitrophota bacterium]